MNRRTALIGAAILVAGVFLVVVLRGGGPAPLTGEPSAESDLGLTPENIAWTRRGRN